ncbi:MAG: 4Fe-4S dicluster domain-containing protein [Bryobacteraceae bacterium]
MAELVPIPLPLLLRRAFLEYEREGKIFDLPQSKFFRGLPGLDLSVSFHGHRASTPLGPAAGPHGQLAQNIVLSWLGGSRIIELKTIQILDELQIPRPCIDAANVGYNVEWSQELRLEQSLREYVGAAMFLEILRASRLLGEGIPEDTVFDMSAGYNLEGIRSSRVRQWIASMKDARAVIDELRAGLTGELARYRDLPFPARISDTVSLSTFHGCPAGEIEGIAEFLLGEMDCHVCIKLNPTLLGRAEIEHLLHEVLGYRDIQLHPPAFENDLQWDEAVDLIPRLHRRAAALGKGLSVKFCNTLVVKNHKRILSGDLMYMSGAPLHVIAIRLVKKFRQRVPEPIPISFSGGIDAHNIADAVAMNFVPVTTCTDLLRPGGYGRLVRYLDNLGERMRGLGVTRIADFVLRYRGQAQAAGGDVHAAGLLNTPILAAEATANSRYAWERNRGVPRKIGSRLWLYDCINCDKCVPVCPNDANFVYETPAVAIEYDNFELPPGGAQGALRRVPGGVLRVVKAHQLANYADVCNECGNCDIFCPEDGGPQHQKPRFFSSLETYRKQAGENGFFIDWETRVPGRELSIYGTIAGRQYALTLSPPVDRAWFDTEAAEAVVCLSDHQVLNWRLKGRAAETGSVLDLLPYLKLKLLAESIGDPRHVHFANVAGLGGPRPCGPGAAPQPRDGGTVPLPRDGGTVPRPCGPGAAPQPRDGSTVPLPRDGGTVPLPCGPGAAPQPRDGGTVPVPRDGGAAPQPRDGGAVPLPPDGGTVPLPRGPGVPPQPLGAHTDCYPQEDTHGNAIGG